MLRQRLLSGGVWALLSRVVAVVAGVGVNAILARLLTPDELGAYFLAVSIISFFTIVACMGLPQVLVRQIVRLRSRGDSSQVNSIVLSAFVMVFTTGLLLMLLFGLGVGQMAVDALFHSAVLKETVVWVFLLIVIAALLQMVSEAFRGFHDIRQASVFGTALNMSLMFIVMLYVFYSGVSLSVVDAIQLLMVCYIVTLILASLFLKRKLSGYHCHQIRLSGFTELLSSGMAIMLMGAATFLSFQGALWFVGYALDQHAVALYGVVLQMTGVLVMLHGLLAVVSQSSMAELFAKKQLATLEKLTRTVALLSLLLAVSILLVFVLFGSELLAVVFGSSYQESYTLLVLVCSFYTVGIFFGPSGMVLMMSGQEKRLMNLVFISILMRVVLAGSLVEPFGLMGIAAGWGIGGWMQNVMSWVLVKRELNISSHVGWYPLWKKGQFHA